MDKAHLTADALCDFAEGLLAPADRLEAEAHLAACAACRREVAVLQEYFQEMSGLGTLKAPDRFLTKVHRRIAHASPWKRMLSLLSSPRFLPVPLGGLAVILVGIYLAFLSPRLAEQALLQPPSEPAAKSPETTVRLAGKQQAEAPAAAETAARESKAIRESAAAPSPAAEPPAPIAMAAKPSTSPADPAPVAEKGLAARSLAKRNRSDARPAVGHPGPAPSLGQAEAAPAAGTTGDKERKLKDEEVVGWLDNPSAVYILDHSGPGDAVLDQIASSRGPADRLEDAPSARAGSAPAPEGVSPADQSLAEDQAPSPVAKAESKAVADAEADADAPVSRRTARTSGPVAVASESRKRAAEAAVGPPTTTPKPWAPQAYSLKTGTDESVLRSGLAKLGVKVLRQDNAAGRRYELEVPATKVVALETFLGGLGALTTSPSPREKPISGSEPHSDPSKPDAKSAAPIRLTLKLFAL